MGSPASRLFVFVLGATCAATGWAPRVGAQDEVGERPRPPQVVLDPTGVLDCVGGHAPRFQLRFPELAWPAPGEYELGDAGLSAGFVENGRFRALQAGHVVIEAFDPERVRFQIQLPDGAPTPTLAVSAQPELRRLVPPEVRGARSGADTIALITPGHAEDLVVCAFGSAGTGLPGQRRVAASIEALAREQGLDFVLLLGDQFAPDGVADRTDPKWQSRFEQVYTMRALPMPFYAVPGDAEHRGDLSTPVHYAMLSPRFTMPGTTYSFEHRVAGTRVGFFALDTSAIAGSVGSPLTRRARSIIPQALEQSRAGWRIAFGHAPMHSHADGVDRGVAETVRRTMEPWLERTDVDLYVSGGAKALELIRSETGTLHVSAGGGGGPEVARSVTWADDTLFAATGGGTVWLRVTPAVLEIAFRGVDGELLHVHRLEKAR